MKEFNLELAKQGHPVCTRNGRKARIVCTDYKSISIDRHILALIEQEDNTEEIASFKNNGSFGTHGISDYDLMMASVKHEGWVNVYQCSITGRYKVGDVFDSEECAKSNTQSNEYITTVKIEWEE